MVDFDQLKKNLKGLSKGNIITTVGSDKDLQWINSPAYDLNRTLSGSLYKSVQESLHAIFVGPEACGKSSLMALLAADAQKKGFLPFVFNIEGAWTNKFVTRWGLDPDNMLLFPGNFVEDVTLQLVKMYDAKMSNLCIIIDSIGALESRKMIEDATTKNDVKADQGALAKKIKRMLKIIVGIVKFNENVLVLSAGHTYKNPNSYGSGEEIGGGGYLKLSADILISLKKSPIYEFPNETAKKNKGRILGNQINASTLKNRLYPPFQESVINIDFQNGVNKMAGLVDIGLDMGLIEKAGSWYSINGERCGQGKEKVYEYFKEYPENLLNPIEEYLKTTGYSNVNKDLELEFGEDKE